MVRALMSNALALSHLDTDGTLVDHAWAAVSELAELLQANRAPAWRQNCSPRQVATWYLRRHQLSPRACEHHDRLEAAIINVIARVAESHEAGSCSRAWRLVLEEVGYFDQDDEFEVGD